MSGELIDQIRLGWVVLAEAADPAAGGITTHELTRIESGALLLGLDVAGIPCLLIPASGPGPEEDGGIVSVRNRELVTGLASHPFVVVACREPSLRDVFDHFLVGVVGALEEADGSHPGAVAIAVLARWQSLFRTGGEAMGSGALAALLAELLVLEAVVAREAHGSTAAWVGPDEARHDFRRGSHAIEVKSTLSHTGRTVTVHGVDQLEAPAGGTLHLAWMRLEVVPDGSLSVYTVCDRIIAAGVPAVDLHDRMDRAGSPPALREVHGRVRFELREQGWFEVGPDFPRIVPASFAGGMPVGVDDLVYRVDLPPQGSALDPAATEVVLKRVAGFA